MLPRDEGYGGITYESFHKYCGEQNEQLTVM